MNIPTYQLRRQQERERQDKRDREKRKAKEQGFLTTQKVYGLLRKAGLQRARWNASGRVKGWGSGTEGYEVSQENPFSPVDVEYCPSTNIHKRYAEGEFAAIEREALSKAKAVMEAAGLAAEIVEQRWSNRLLLQVTNPNAKKEEKSDG